MTKKEEALMKRMGRLSEAIYLLLDAVDYKTGACKPTEMVGAVLPEVILTRVRKILRGEI